MENILNKLFGIIIGCVFVISGMGVFGMSTNENSDLSVNDSFDMVIISPKIFSNQIQRLIDHKNDVGIDTFLKTTE